MYRARDGIVDFDKSRSASAARRASPPAPTTRSSSTPTTTPPRSATSARIARRRTRAGLRGRLPDRGDPRRRPQRPALQGRPDRRARARVACAAPRRRRSRSSSTAARIRRRSIRSPRAGPTAACSCGASRATLPHQVHVRASRRRQQLCRRRARLRRAAPHAVGLAADRSTPGPRASPPARTSCR